MKNVFKLTEPQNLVGSVDRLHILYRLIFLRVIALCSFTLYVTYFAPQSNGLFTITVLALLSLGLSAGAWLYFRNGRPVNNSALLIQIIWDVLTILIFVSMTGRSTNPFIYYLLVMVAISAGILGEKGAWTFALCTITAYSSLMYLDINQHIAHLDADFKSHLFGMWINFVGSAILICFFISRLTQALKQRERALSLAREEILKNEQLIGIGTLAASTVHSFGTPLSTIAMAIAEIEAIHNDPETLDCTKTIKTQIDRCKNTMAKLTSLASYKATLVQNMALSLFTSELKEHFFLVNSYPMPKFSLEESKKDSELPGGVLLLHAIINLIENAVKAADKHVSVIFYHQSHSLKIEIEDDGEGLEEQTLEKLGDAIISSVTGLGIGFLLANSTIERIGGSVRFSNPSKPEGNSMTRVTVEIPLNE